MRIHVLVGVFIAFAGGAYAQGDKPAQEELLSHKMCRHGHDYNYKTQTCIYCAHHLTRNADSKQCEDGELSPLGKCIGDDHFHAATLECHYCAKDHEFNEKTRKCESNRIILAD